MADDREAKFLDALYFGAAAGPDDHPREFRLRAPQST
jgi:hypothetical protein